LKRIKSELETIQERKEDIKPEEFVMPAVIPENEYMKGIMVDESYSFSMRNFDKAAESRRMQGNSSQGGEYFDQPRISSLSIYNKHD